MSVIKTAIKSLELHGELPPKYKAHKLTGNYSGFWECHLKADWLLVWMQNEEGHTLLFTDTGSHSDLF
jgi:mRNA interferase YafQ